MFFSFRYIFVVCARYSVQYFWPPSMVWLVWLARRCGRVLLCEIITLVRAVTPPREESALNRFFLGWTRRTGRFSRSYSSFLTRPDRSFRPIHRFGRKSRRIADQHWRSTEKKTIANSMSSANLSAIVVIMINVHPEHWPKRVPGRRNSEQKFNNAFSSVERTQCDQTSRFRRDSTNFSDDGSQHFRVLSGR